MLHQCVLLDALSLPACAHRGPGDAVGAWAYLELLAEQGVLGLGTFVLLAGAGVATLARIIRTRQRDLHLLVAGAGASLVAFLTAALIELSFIRGWVTIILFTLLGLLVTITRVEREGRA
jgi:O-antigen ligase